MENKINDVEIVVEKEIPTLKKKKKTIKERQLGRIKRLVPGIDEEEVSNLLDDPYDNREDLRLAIVEQDKDPKEVLNNSIFSKKLVKYINEFKEDVVDEINETIEEAKEEISNAVDDILEDKKADLFESMLNKFELLIELMNTKVEYLDKIKEKYDDMVEDMENRIVESKPLNKIENTKIQEMPSGLARMLYRQ